MTGPGGFNCRCDTVLPPAFLRTFFAQRSYLPPVVASPSGSPPQILLLSSLMKIRILDIPHEGLDTEVEVDCSSLNARVAAVNKNGRDKTIPPPSYTFTAPPKAKFHLSVEGLTVTVVGKCSAEYQTPCARCAEDTLKSIVAPLNVILKAPSAKQVPGASDEDLQFGFHDGAEVNLGSLAEEYLVLALPYLVLCSEKCLGLCPHCGKNKNIEPCACKEQIAKNNPFSALKDLKLQ